MNGLAFQGTLTSWVKHELIARLTLMGGCLIYFASLFHLVQLYMLITEAFQGIRTSITVYRCKENSTSTF